MSDAPLRHIQDIRELEDKLLGLKFQENLKEEYLDDRKTRRKRLKSALYLRLKKRKTFFLEKNLNFSKKNSFGKCRTLPKNVKDPF